MMKGFSNNVVFDRGGGNDTTLRSTTGRILVMKGFGSSVLLNGGGSSNVDLQ